MQNLFNNRLAKTLFTGAYTQARLASPYYNPDVDTPQRIRFDGTQRFNHLAELATGWDFHSNATVWTR